MWPRRWRKPAERAKWAREFERLLQDYRFLPAGRILSVIAPGLKRREFSETLQETIETATARLVREATG